MKFLYLSLMNFILKNYLVFEFSVSYCFLDNCFLFYFWSVDGLVFLGLCIFVNLLFLGVFNYMFSGEEGFEVEFDLDY